MEMYENLVGGSWVTARSGKVRERFDPADSDRLVARSPEMSADEVEEAIDSSRQAAADWREMGALGRGQVMARVGAILRERSEEIAADIVRENGKTLAEARVEAGFGASFFDYYASLGREPLGSVLADRRPDTVAWHQREPLGVVAIITPWNDPFAIPARKLAPAMLVGNTVVFKPASETPVSAYHLSRAFVDAGLPPGVVNVVTGRSSEVGPAILTSSTVKAVSFTGSTDVGLDISRTLGGTTTRLQTEMGGKNAVLVLDDADLEQAVATVAGSACGQSGQRCTATSRLILESGIADRFLGMFEDRFRDMTVGPGDAENVQMGPLITDGHLGSVLEAVQRAGEEGADVRVGGERLTEGALARGNFMAPTVVSEVNPRMELWREEIFGPVAAVTTVASFDEGVELVNDSSFGLSSAVHTTNLETAHRFVDAVETGQVAVNRPTGGWDLHVPFGGFRASGSPFKENGVEALRFYSRIKAVAMGFRP